jgi:hypothetical protein
MSTFYGADVGQLRSLAGKFDQMADQLDAGRMSVGNAIQISAWVGPYASSFRHQWASEHSARISGAAATLRAAARQVRSNADGQERVSAVDGGSGSGRSGHLPPKACVENSRQPEVITKDTAYGSDVTIKDKWGDSYGGTWTTEERARGGLQVDPSADAGFNEEKMRWEGNLGVDAQYGWETHQEANYENGLIDAGVESNGFAGVRGDIGVSGSAGADGVHGHAGASGFAGAEQSVGASVDVGGVEGGVEAGIMAGVGGEASADLDISADEIKVEAKIGFSFGLGVSVKPSISIKPKEIMHNVFGFLGF